MKNIFYVLSACLLTAHAAQAGVLNWVGGTGTEWDTPANWSTGYLPGSNAIDRAILSTGDNVTISSPLAAHSDVDLDLQQPTSTLAIGADFGNIRRLYVRKGTVTQTAGAVTVTDTQSNSYIDNGGTWAISGGSYAMNGDLEVRAGGGRSL